MDACRQLKQLIEMMVDADLERVKSSVRGPVR
jgi:hypothetical protein